MKKSLFLKGIVTECAVMEKKRFTGAIVHVKADGRRRGMNFRVSGLKYKGPDRLNLNDHVLILSIADKPGTSQMSVWRNKKHMGECLIEKMEIVLV